MAKLLLPESELMCYPVAAGRYKNRLTSDMPVELNLVELSLMCLRIVRCISIIQLKRAFAASSYRAVCAVARHALIAPVRQCQRATQGPRSAGSILDVAKRITWLAHVVVH